VFTFAKPLVDKAQLMSVSTLRSLARGDVTAPVAIDAIGYRVVIDDCERFRNYSSRSKSFCIENDSRINPSMDELTGRSVAAPVVSRCRGGDLERTL
jgi:hypothetical protein